MRTFESDFERDLYAARQQTLRDIAALGHATYPNRFPAEGEADTIPAIRSTYDHAPAAEFDLRQAEGKPIQVAVAGRLMAIRTQGKAGFAQLQGGGQRLQIYVRKDAVGDPAFALYKLLDLGDHIGVHGHLFRTRTGELTIHVGPGPAAEPAITFLAKAMLALPDKYHGLEDVELRYRQRYVDLIMNSGTLSKNEAPTAPGVPRPALGDVGSTLANPLPPGSSLVTATSASPTEAVILTLSEAQGKNPRISSAEPPSPGSAAESLLPGSSPVTETSASLPGAVILSAAKNPRILSAEPPSPGSAAEPLLPGPSPAAETSASLPGAVLLSAAKNPRILSAEPPSPGSATETIAPGSSVVTETALPNNQHLDAPRNVREVFEKRSKILRSIRNFFDHRGYLEVETPMMHTVAGGAAARPFKTHHNALDIDLSLRIAPELYLKRLVVGGLDRVYEINRNFRNEGVSTQHNPEFTMLEFYQAYSNYHDLMNLTVELVTKVATEVNGTPTTHFNGHTIDLSKKWERLTMREAIVKFWPSFVAHSPSSNTFDDVSSFLKWSDQFLVGTITMEHNPDGALQQARYLQLLEFVSRLSQSVSGGTMPLGKATAELFEYLGEDPAFDHLIQPTIIYDFPLAVSPLSKQKPDEPDWVERFEFYIGGFEVGNAFSELNDPEEQRKRFEQQISERDRGDDEAHAMDEDYVRALGYGLPPTAGEGIGIDRLTMLLTGSRSIRDVILFPLLRPQTKAQPESEPKPE